MRPARLFSMEDGEIAQGEFDYHMKRIAEKDAYYQKINPWKKG